MSCILLYRKNYIYIYIYIYIYEKNNIVAKTTPAPAIYLCVSYQSKHLQTFTKVKTTKTAEQAGKIPTIFLWTLFFYLKRKMSQCG